MNLQIIPFGLVIFGLYAGLILLLVIWPLSRLLKGRSWRRPLLGIVAAVLLASPFAEEFWIAWHFRELCRDAGVHVYRKVEVDGFYDSTGGGINKPGPTYPPNGGRERFRFYERLIGYDPKASPLQISHVEKVDGQWEVSILDRPTARYHYKHAYQPTPYKYEEPVGHKVEKMESQVVDAQTGEVLGRDTQFKRRPGAVDSMWIGLVGSGLTICTGPLGDPVKQRRIGLIYDYVLIAKELHLGR